MVSVCSPINERHGIPTRFFNQAVSEMLVKTKHKVAVKTYENTC